MEPPVQVKAPPMTAVKSKAAPSTIPQARVQSSEIEGLQGRMSNVEQALQEVIHHLRNLSTSPQSWTLVKEEPNEG